MAVTSTKVISVVTFLKNDKLCIPHFQRPYKWTVKNVIQLLEDLERFKNQTSYRIGTIIVHLDKGHYNIVDGQQRTLTLCLILKAIHNSQVDLSDVTKRQVADVIQKLFDPAFKSEISKQHIRENYAEIQRRVRNMDDEVINFLLNGCELTYLVIDDLSEAFQFFDSQNSRGKELDPHDLLKAYHLRELRTEPTKDEINVTKLVQAWEDMDSKQLASLFSNFLYRIRGWSKGNSSRYFTKADINLFKGVNLNKTEKYPYTELLSFVKDHHDNPAAGGQKIEFPFQIDQTIINGTNFFEMISHYKNVFDKIRALPDNLSKDAKEIVDTINNYAGMDRTGDKYVRMIFDCALMYYLDKFGDREPSKAIVHIFIWAYSLRLEYQSLQLASVDNYIVTKMNIFKKIKDSVHKEDIFQMDLPFIQKPYESDKTTKIKDLFVKMNYCEQND